MVKEPIPPHIWLPHLELAGLDILARRASEWFPMNKRLACASSWYLQKRHGHTLSTLSPLAVHSPQLLQCSRSLQALPISTKDVATCAGSKSVRVARLKWSRHRYKPMLVSPYRKRPQCRWYQTPKKLRFRDGCDLATLARTKPFKRHRFWRSFRTSMLERIQPLSVQILPALQQTTMHSVRIELIRRM